MDQSEESLFEEALNRYKAGSQADELIEDFQKIVSTTCLLYTSPSPRDGLLSRMPSSA